MGLDNSKLTVTSQVFGSMSVVACTLALTTFACFPGSRNVFAYLLVISLMTSDMGRALIDVTSFPASVDTSLSCYAQAWLRTVFQLSSAISTTAIAFTIYKQFVKPDRRYDNQMIFALKWRYFTIVWVFPCIVACGPFFTHDYNDAGIFCWIGSNSKTGVVWRVVCYYSWLWICIFASCYFYWNLRDEQIDREQRARFNAVDDTPGGDKTADTRTYHLHTITFLVALTLRAVFVSLHQAYVQFTGQEQEVLLLLRVFFADLTPVANAITWLTTPYMRKSLWNDACACGCCWRAGRFEADNILVMSSRAPDSGDSELSSS